MKKKNNPKYLRKQLDFYLFGQSCGSNLLTWSKLYLEVLIRKIQKNLKLLKNPDSGRWRIILQPPIKVENCGWKNSTFMASNHQNLTPIDDF